MGPLRRSGVGAGEGSGDKEGEKSLSVCLQPRDDRRGCRPVDGGAEAQSAAAGSRRGYSEAGGCSLVGLGSSAASHRDGRFVVRAAASRTGAGVGVFAFVGERGGTSSRVVRAGESRELEFKMLRGRGAESSKLGAVMGGSRVGGSWAPVSLEERGVRQDSVWWSCWLPVVAEDSKILPSFNHVFYILRTRTVACSSRPTSWSDGSLNTLSSVESKAVVVVQLLACSVFFSRPGSSRRTGAKSVGWPARQLARDRGDQDDRCGAIKRTPVPHYGRGGAGLAVGAEHLGR